MNYDAISQVYLQPLEGPPPVVDLPTSPARRLRDALEPLATHGWWCEPTNRRMEALGLTFLPAYVWGRAAALGEPEPNVVVATFGVFEPSFLRSVYTEARAAASRADVLAAREAGTVESLRSILAGMDVNAVAEPLRSAVTDVDGSARPLFSGLRGLPWPEDPCGVLWRAAELVREHRGDGHLAACIAAGLDPVEMNVLTELWLGIPTGSYLATRGYASAEEALGRLADRGLVADGGLTAEGRALRDDVEERTDVAAAPIVTALGDRLDGVVAEAARWSQLVIDAGAFPPDPYKRAAG